MKWDHVVRDKNKKLIFSGPMDACVSYYRAGNGMKYGWTVERMPHGWTVKDYKK